MTTAEWETIWALLESLWPRMTADMTSEQIASYRRVCEPFSENDCRVVLRTWYDTQSKYPRSAEVGRALRERKRARAESGEDDRKRRQAEAAERERIERRWADIRDTLADQSDDELAEHKRMILAANWRLRWAAGFDARTSRVWQVFIYRRICAGRVPAMREAVDWGDCGDDGRVVEVTDAMLAEADAVLAKSANGDPSLASALTLIGGPAE